ncbi:hypothetical protein Tco_0170263 [Tanacetum coccineum]
MSDTVPLIPPPFGANTDIPENGPFVPLSPLSTPTNPLPKPQNQWSHADRRLANQDKRLKSILISCLPNDGPSETKDTKIAALRLKFNAFITLEEERVNGTFTRLQDSDSDIEEDQKSSSEFLAVLNVEFHERALPANQR